MNFSVNDIQHTGFYTDKESDDLNDSFKGRLGMDDRYMPARLAIGYSLAFPFDKSFQCIASGGRTIRGHTLFGDETQLASWITLIIEHATRNGQKQNNIDIKELVRLVAAHWRRGLQQFDREWKEAEEDSDKFILRLAEKAELPHHRVAVDSPTKGDSVLDFPNEKISIPLGTEISTGKNISWPLNGRGGSPHIALMGGVGSGKTRTAATILKAIREQTNVPCILLDFKGDLGTDAQGNGYRLDKHLSATTIEPPRTPIPLDIFAFSKPADEFEIAEIAENFRDSFSNIKGGNLGPKQKEVFYEAATRALRLRQPCELIDIRDTLERVYEEKEMKEDGAMATMNEICRFPLFEPDKKAQDFFQKSWIVKLPSNVSENNRGIIVNLTLDALDRYLNNLLDAPIADDGSRKLRLLCMIDEARRILGKKPLPALSNLMRMSRSKGGAILLASQSPDDFSGAEDEFLNEMGLVVSFGTNARPGAAKRILGAGTNLANLKKGECYAKLREESQVKKIQAW